MSHDSPIRIGSLIPFWPTLLIAPALALGLAGLAGGGPRMLRKNKALSGLLVGAGVLGIAKWQLDRFFTESPAYDVERVVGDLEIRRYPPRVVAETTVSNVDHDKALSEGFSRLARYIFGGNRERNGVKAERIAMTTPVTAHRRSDASDASDQGFVVTFTMPRDHALEQLPIPDDARVRVRRADAERYAVLGYRGTYRGGLAKEKQAELLALVRGAGLVARGEPLFAGYDAPSTLPSLRRVEAWVLVA